MAHITPLLDAGILPVAVVSLSKAGDEWFISATYPAHLGLFNGGIYHAETGDTIDEAVEKVLAWFEQQWSGL